jgi:flagellar protein FliJ
MFKFRLQRVLDLREKREEEAATELAAARGEAERALELARALEAEQHSHIRTVAASAGGGVSVGQLQNLSLLVQRMGEQVSEAYRAVDSAEVQVRDRLTQFASAFREKQVLHKLKDRDLTAWRAAEVQADRSAMDDIALSQFVRAAAGSAAGEGAK